MRSLSAKSERVVFSKCNSTPAPCHCKVAPATPAGNEALIELLSVYCFGYETSKSLSQRRGCSGGEKAHRNIRTVAELVVFGTT